MALISNLQDKSIYFVDLSTPNSPSVISTLNLGFRGEDIALSNDGTYAIVSTDYKDLSKLAVIDVLNRSLIQSLNISPRNAQAVEIAPGGTVLIADYYNSKIHTMLLNLSNGTLTDLNSFIEVGSEPTNITVSPDGQIAIVANIGANSLSILKIISPGNVILSETITGMNKPQSISFDHIGQRAFIVQSGTSPDQIVVLSVSSSGNVTDTGIRIPLLSDGVSGYFGVDVIAINFDNQYGYVGNPSSGTTSNSISIIDLNNYTLVDSLLCGNHPVGVSLPIFTTDNGMPVELISFKATVSRDRVSLSWQTATETNSCGFDIERQTNDNDWASLGFVEGSGNSNSAKQYTFTDNNPLGGSKFFYRLKQVDNDGQYEYSDVVEVDLQPEQYTLYQNYPNPFNPSTTIKFSLPDDVRVRIHIYNSLGELVAEVINKDYKAGYHKVEYSGANIPSGIYFYRIIAGELIETKKMILMK
jgi:DNA-binding beta-propeller fold protein YncE